MCIYIWACTCMHAHTHVIKCLYIITNVSYPQSHINDKEIAVGKSHKQVHVCDHSSLSCTIWHLTFFILIKNVKLYK